MSSFVAALVAQLILSQNQLTSVVSHITATNHTVVAGISNLFGHFIMAAVFL
jgi:hypothetical protein